MDGFAPVRRGFSLLNPMGSGKLQNEKLERIIQVRIYGIKGEGQRSNLVLGLLETVFQE